MSKQLRIRAAARAVLLDPDDRVLLVEFAFPRSLTPGREAPLRRLWAAPGGGMEPGEHPHDTLRRELDEELGHAVEDIGPEIWNRTVHVPFLDGSHDGQRDRYFLVRSPAFDPEPTIGWEQLRNEYVVDIRWWTLTEIVRSEVTFAPRSFGSVLGDLLRSGPPDVPIDVGR